MPGATHLSESAELTGIIKSQMAAGKLVAAICAAPAVVLAPLGILNGKRATGYPAPKFNEVLAGVVEGKAPAKDRVVVDGNVVTSQGPGTSLAFALELVKQLQGDEMRSKLAAEMLFE